MDSAAGDYLATIANDSTIWRRRGRHGAICFIDGVIEALIATEAISKAEASKWSMAFMSSTKAYSSEFIPSPDTKEVTGERNSPQGVPVFLELIPIDGASTVVPGAATVQILGIERYDSKAAVIWRAVPSPAPAKSESLSHFAQFGIGPNQATTKLTDDVGTPYVVVGGHSGGRIERVGRFEFRPAPPKSATLLFLRWDGAAFDIALPQDGQSAHLV